MSLTSAELAAVAREVLQRVRGYRVAKVYQLGRHDLILHFREDKKLKLFISVRPRYGRIYLTTEKFAAPKSPTPFAQLLRKHLSGRPLAGIYKRLDDRQVSLLFVPGGLSLHCRMYAGGGFWLAAGDGTVLGCDGYTSRPPVKVGDTYEPPEAGEEQPAQFDGSASAQIEERYRHLLEKDGFETDKRLLLSAVKKELTKCNKLLASLTRDRERLIEYSGYKKLGDLCKTWFHKLKRGVKSVTLPDLETGKEVKIPLSPELSPVENMNLLYKKYRKYATGIKKVDPALKAAGDRRKMLEAEKAGLENAKDTEELADYRKKTAVSLAVRKKRRGPEKASPFREFVSKDGFEIRVGKSNIANDKLVRASNGNDLWFHIQGFPGSHVVVRAGRKGQIPQATVMEAARLALKHSSRAKDKKGTVVYTHIKYVKRPKHAPPGTVRITQEKTVHARLS